MASNGNIVETQPHEMTPEQLAEKLGTNLHSGLTADQAATKLVEDGPNELEKSPKPTLLM
eukprot:CAMPEP_0195113648 /NCGR_PEP_ID=MMETSP0448-20130528/103270_1 /TAXON_ID=66468 /ORGANISM="Heterocapsa triquestra, Strain CCMP 448" /LENGTH=59 /DNA_ID=CAMNT_0040150611 /DNA_START=24 /DNA_END=200 /DNA_ORIENTATION=+